MAAIPAFSAVLMVAVAIATASIAPSGEEEDSVIKIDGEDEVQIESRRARGTNYVRWGVSSCPRTAKLVYTGVAAGSHYSHIGGGANHICLHNDPQFLEVVEGLQSLRGLILGTEYESHAPSPAFGDYADFNVPCAVCSTRARGEMLMIPGRTECERSWTREYYGYLMSSHDKHHRSTYVCVDVDAEAIPDSGVNRDGDLFYFQEAVCNGISCPPYEEGYEVTCVVCTR